MIAPDQRAHYMAAGRTAFNHGEFYDAHEHWEAVWDDADEPERSWLQGMIQVATGLHKLGRGRGDVALRLIGSGLGKLDGAPELLDGCQVGTLRRVAAEIVAALAARQPLPALPTI
jgi:uncharacterized protein